MTVQFKASFLKDIRGIKDKSSLKRIQSAIEQVEQAQSSLDIPNLKKLRIGNNYYRMRV